MILFIEAQKINETGLKSCCESHSLYGRFIFSMRSLLYLHFLAVFCHTPQVLVGAIGSQRVMRKSSASHNSSA
jgi:hypothetical protein